MSTFTQINDVDGDSVTVQSADYAHRPEIVTSVHDDHNGTYHDLDRENAVRMIEALTAAVEAADAREAAEARKLKRGDLVRLVTNRTWLYTVLSDEDTDGRVDLVCLERWGRPAGDILNDPVEGFERVTRFE